MTKAVKKEKNITIHNKSFKELLSPVAKDELRVNLAIGVLTLLLTIVLLYILDSTIYKYYTPDIDAILSKVIPLTFLNPGFFRPEPVERMQFQLALLCTPLFIFLAYTIMNKTRSFFDKNSSLAYFINIAGIVLFALYLFYLLDQPLLYVPDPDNPNGPASNAFFFRNNVIHMSIFMVVIYCFCAYAYLVYRNTEQTTTKKIIINIISYSLAGIVIIDIIFYNFFHLGAFPWDRTGETNPVFSSITQVYVGKSLLVNTNAQYGLYAWMLNPIFRLIGLSLDHISYVMMFLNGLTFALFYLGIKKFIKQDTISLITFLCFMYWQYWHQRIPFEDTPRQYYQYWPIRVLFPAIAFYLFVTFQSATPKLKRFILPVMAVLVSFGVLWNVDSGLVAYGATLIALIFSAIDLSKPVKEIILKCIPYVLWMVGGLCFAIAMLYITTKANSGSWPDIKGFLAYQSVFYISGFFMLPMNFIHFWNLPVIVYLITGIYCLYHIKRANERDLPVVVFLFILGIGLFAYFQGRSFDLSLTAVMYPAIIMLGYFCSRFMFKVEGYKIKFHESIIIFLIPFLFLTDGSFSMIYYTPSIHNFALKSAFTLDEKKEDSVQKRVDFVMKNVPKKDTVIILANSYESYFYASGQYYYPLNLPGSTELFYKWQVDTLLAALRSARYPVIYDAAHPWVNSDTIIKTLSKYSVVGDVFPDLTLLYLKPSKDVKPRLNADQNTVYHEYYGDFRKYITPTVKLNLNESFSVELLVTLDSTKLKKDNYVFSNESKTTPFCGIFMTQYGNDLNQFIFSYGDGKTWGNFPVFKLKNNVENHLLFRVDNNVITVFNNGEQIAQTNRSSGVIKNSNGIFSVNPYFPGKIPEICITNH